MTLMLRSYVASWLVSTTSRVSEGELSGFSLFGCSVLLSAFRSDGNAR